MENLTMVQRNFLDVYLTNGRNGTKAYQSLHPNVSDSTAAAAASRILKRQAVLAFIRGNLPDPEVYVDELGAIMRDKNEHPSIRSKAMDFHSKYILPQLNTPALGVTVNAEALEIFKRGWMTDLEAEKQLLPDGVIVKKYSIFDVTPNDL